MSAKSKRPIPSSDIPWRKRFYWRTRNQLLKGKGFAGPAEAALSLVFRKRGDWRRSLVVKLDCRP